MRRIFNQLMPFLIIGIVVVVLIFGIMLLAYLFVFGAILGFFLYFINWIRTKFFPPKQPLVKKKSHSGRIIDSDEFKHMK